MSAERHRAVFHSASENETRRLGAKLGAWLTPGTLLLLEGDLGCGKTVFVQGLAKGLAVPETVYVTSPTYTLINAYPARLPFYHADLYRLGPEAELEEIGLVDLMVDENIVAVEWGGHLSGDWMKTSLHFHFRIIGDSARQIEITSPTAQGRALAQKLIATQGL